MSSSVNRRLPAEWEPVEAVLLAWPHADTDWAHMLHDVHECYNSIIRAIAPFANVIVVGPDLDLLKASVPELDSRRCLLCPVETNDTWTRDYGAITVFDNEVPLPLNFKFNGWGLKFAADHDNMVTSAMADFGLFAREPENHLSFVMEGGSIESDGRGLVLTTESCMLSPNRNGGMTRGQIEDYIATSLGAKKILWLKHGHLAGDDTDGHIDTLARLAPEGDVIFYTGCADPADEHYDELKEMERELRSFTTLDGKPFHLLELPLPDPVFDADDGHRLPATYANFLIVNDAVILPTYNQPLKDKMAADIIAAAMPHHTVVPVDCRALIRQHGSLHCATMQFPVNTFSIWTKNSK